MKLLTILALFLALILLFLWLCKKIDPSFTIAKLLDGLTNTKPVTQPLQSAPIYPGVNLVYKEYQADYESFASLVRDCLGHVGAKCELSIPSNPGQIFCSEVDNRVKIINGIRIFSFEVSRQEPCFQGRKQVPTTSTAEIARMLVENLPNYMRDGYYYIGNVYVWDTEKNRIRIEIQGVDRRYFVPEDIIIMTSDTMLKNVAYNAIAGFLLMLGIVPSEGEDTLELKDYGPHRVFTQQAQVPPELADSLDAAVVFAQLRLYNLNRNTLPTAIPFYAYNAELYRCPCGCGTFLYVSIYHNA